MSIKNFNFVDREFESHLFDASFPNQPKIVGFLTHLAICHTITQQKQKRKQQNGPPTNRPKPVIWEESYSASSPDELALVNAASHFGVRFKSRPSSNQIEIEYDSSKVGGLEGVDKKETFEILQILEFTSHRKMMSVIVKTPDGSIKVLTKGSDSVLTKLLAPIDERTDSGLE
jgi:magnesium-transporting ATPase (P-type)